MNNNNKFSPGSSNADNNIWKYNINTVWFNQGRFSNGFNEDLRLSNVSRFSL